MNKVLILLITTLFGVSVFGQSTENSALLKLGKAYEEYMFRSTPEKKYLKSFVEEYPSSLQQEAKFIKQTISSDNKLLEKEFLSIPDQAVLKNLFIVSEIHAILVEESKIIPNELIDSLKQIEIPRYELVDNYYYMLFTGVGNKNQPYNFNKNDFNLADYGLKDEVEKGIFFLKCMDLCGRNIWGFMNIVNPPNTSKALSYIKKYPTFNGKPYYQFTDLYFKDFEMIIIKENGIQSYKSYYLDKYYETLLSHLICLDKDL
ncbi:MAG: hypothetical protein ACKVTZ_19740 [Bacteroidia bacterium]